MNQQVQGPCHVFAAAALIETVHSALFGIAADVSEMHFYSPCAHANLLSTTIEDALAFAQTTGVVDETCLPYVSGSMCNTTPPPASSCNATTSGFFADQVYTGAVPSCGTPWCQCRGLTPSLRYRIGGYSSLPIETFADANGLKKALLNRGPIALWMRDARLHVCDGQAAAHAYLLYGWDTVSGQPRWRLRDSWPNGGLTSTDVDIVQLFKDHSEFDAWVLDRAGTTPTVYQQEYSAGTWHDKPQTSICRDGSAGPFSITGPGIVASTPTAYAIANYDLLDDPSLIEWSTEPTPGFSPGAVTISPATGASVSAQMQSGGYVTLVARVKRANGLCEVVKKPVQVGSCAIPTFPQFPVTPGNVDTCPGSSFQVSTSGTGFLEYRWVLSAGLTLDGWNGGSASTSSSIWVRVQPGFMGGVVRLYVRNACGWSTDDNRTYVRKRSYPPCN